MIHLRWGVLRDLPDLLQVEQQSFKWAMTEQDFRDFCSKRNVILRVAEDNDLVCGYMFYEPAKKCVLLHSIAVLADYRRLGVGTLMIDELKRKLRPGREQIRTSVPASNLIGHNFLLCQDFEFMRSVRDASSGEDLHVFKFQSKVKA